LNFRAFTPAPPPQTELHRNVMSKSRALLVITDSPPYPVRHGASVDQWHRYKLLRELGWDLVLASWVPRADAPEVDILRAALSDVFSDVFLFPNWTLRATLRRLALLPWRPPGVSSRALSEAQRAPLIEAARARGVSAILNEGYPGYALARAAAEALDAPVFLRSHNIEHAYLARQSRAARRLAEKMKIRLSAHELRRYETQVHREVSWSFDCSHADLAFWRAHGFTRQSWLPPMFDDESASAPPRIAWDERLYDAAYLGNLTTPNNVEAVRWFVDRVAGPLFAARPNFKLLIAGSNPSPDILRLMETHPEIEFLIDVEDPATVRANARVLINPIFTGSGINVKSVEMLFTDSPIVVSPVGVQGFSPRFREAFIVVEDADDFIAAIHDALEKGPVPDAERAPLRREFGRSAAQRFSDDLYGKIVSFSRRPRQGAGS